MNIEQAISIIEKKGIEVYRANCLLSKLVKRPYELMQFGQSLGFWSKKELIEMCD